MANATPTYTPEYLAEFSGDRLVDVSITFIVLLTLFVGLRTYARHLAAVKFAWDDALVLVSWFLCVAICGVAIAMVRYGGVGYHEARVYHDNKATLILWAKFLVVESFFYLVVVALPKIAILLIYLRVFPQPAIRRCVYAIGIFMVAYVVIICLTAGLACRPLAYFWDKSLNGNCVDIKSLYQWSSFPNILTDVLMLVLPLPVIWKLQLPTHVKVGLSFTFLTASIGLISSCFRFAEFASTDPLGDGTWASVSLMIWTIVEPGAYTIAACLPTLRPLLVKVRETSRESLRKASFVSFSLNSSKRSGSNDASTWTGKEGINKTTVITMNETSDPTTTQTNDVYYV